MEAAPFWYYTDADDALQGPFSTADMRAWYVAGYLSSELLVAPSFYGEVPETFWQIGWLWTAAVAADRAFASAVAQPAPVAASVNQAFIESATFDGHMQGYAFKTDMYGTGYYLDERLPVEITAKEIEDEKKARRAKALAFVPHTAPTGADFREHKG